MARTIVISRGGGGGVTLPIAISDVTNLQTELDSKAETDADLTLTNQSYSGNLATATTQKEANDLIDALVIGGGGGTIQNTNLSIQAADEGTPAGNARGNNAVDLQTVRSSASQVASGNNSTVSGGNYNTASNLYSTVSGGSNNKANGSYSTVSGGYQNTANGSTSTVSGGYQNIANNTYSTVSGGRSNTANGYASTISGGYKLNASLYGQYVNGGYNVTTGKSRHPSGVTLQLTTTSVTANQEMFIFTSNRITIPANTVYLVTVKVAANDTTNNANASGYIEHGLLLNNAGTVTYQTIGTQQSGSFGSGCGTITVSANNTNKALKVDVSPNSTNTIVWQAEVSLVEVQE